VSTTEQPTAPTATTSTSFWDYLKDNIPNHLKLFGGIVLIVGGIFLWNYVKGLQSQIAE
jgi:hypothetical protein